MLDDYPEDALRAAVVEATRYGMTDLERLERMVLRRIDRDFFKDGSSSERLAPDHRKEDHD